MKNMINDENIKEMLSIDISKLDTEELVDFFNELRNYRDDVSNKLHFPNILEKDVNGFNKPYAIFLKSIDVTATNKLADIDTELNERGIIF